MTIEEIRQHPTLTVAETSRFLRMGKRQTYEAIREGRIPSLRLSGKILIPTGPLLALVGQKVDA